MMARLINPRLAIQLDGTDDPVEVQTRQSDLILYERTAGKHKWPSLGQAPLLWLTFIGWAAMRRQGLTDLLFDPFVEQVVGIENLTDDDEAADDDSVLPTLPGLDPG